MCCFTLYDPIDHAPIWDKLKFEELDEDDEFEDHEAFSEAEVGDINKKLRWTTKCVVVSRSAVMPVRYAGRSGEVIDTEGQEYDCRGIQFIKSKRDLSKGIKAGIAMHAWTWIVLLHTPGLEPMSHSEIWDMLWSASGRVANGPQDTYISRKSDTFLGSTTVENLTFDLKKIKQSCLKLLDDYQPTSTRTSSRRQQAPGRLQSRGTIFRPQTRPWPKP